MERGCSQFKWTQNIRIIIGGVRVKKVIHPFISMLNYLKSPATLICFVEFLENLPSCQCKFNKETDNYGTLMTLMTLRQTGYLHSVPCSGSWSPLGSLDWTLSEDKEQICFIELVKLIADADTCVSGWDATFVDICRNSAGRQAHLGYTWLGPGSMVLQRHKEALISVWTGRNCSLM